VPGAACLIDTNTFVVIRASLRADPSLDPFKIVGSTDLVISDTIYDELMMDLPPSDYKVALNDDLVNQMGGRVIRASDEDAALADAIMRTYARHDPALGEQDRNDAIIAATSMRLGRVLLTRNWKHFHFILGLLFVNIAPWPMGLPILTTRPVETGSHLRACCQRLR
jgi:predicted nucleic acid-binding protein